MRILLGSNYYQLLCLYTGPLTYWLCKFGQTPHIDGTFCVLYVAIQIEGESHDTHTEREQWKHGQNTEAVPQPAFPAGVVH